MWKRTKALVRLIQSWYRVDRVRVPPADGRMLHLKTGDCFVLFETLYVVEGRQVTSGDSDCRVELTLRSDEGSAVLVVSRSCVLRNTVATLDDASCLRDVFDSDIMVVRQNEPFQSGEHKMPLVSTEITEYGFSSLDNSLPAFRAG